MAAHGTVHRLPYRAPFDWAALHAYLAARRVPGIDAVEGQGYARTFRHDGRDGWFRLAPVAGEDALRVEIHVPDPGGLPAVLPRIRRLLDLDADPGAIRAGLGRDPFMAGLVARRPGLRVPGAWDGFEVAVRAILGQQVSVAAATRLAGRLVAAFGGTPSIAAPGLTHLFPSPEALADADVALVLNMPRARGAAIRALSAAALADPDLFAMGRGLDAAVARLTALPGIGPWTAHYVAMRALRETDAFPASDIGVLRALADGTGRPTPAAALARSDVWRPWRAYAVIHLWAHDAAAAAPTGAGP